LLVEIIWGRDPWLSPNGHMQPPGVDFCSVFIVDGDVLGVVQEKRGDDV